MRDRACLSASASRRSATSRVVLARAASVLMPRPQLGQAKGVMLARKMVRPMLAHRTLTYLLKHSLQTLHWHGRCVHSFFSLFFSASLLHFSFAFSPPSFSISMSSSLRFSSPSFFSSFAFSFFSFSSVSSSFSSDSSLSSSSPPLSTSRKSM
jgi:hypothetical protein